MDSVTFDIDGHTFHALTEGEPDNPLLLFLHGFPEFSHAWAGLMSHFADRYFCVAPDQRGNGRSWRPAQVEAYTMPHLVADARAMIDRFGGGHAAAVIGHDWGASVAYALAMRAGDQIDRLIIINGVHPVPFQRAMATGGAQSEASQYINYLRAEGSEDRLTANDFAQLLSLFSAKMDLGWMTPALEQKYKAAWRDTVGLRAMINWYRASPLLVADPGTPIPPDRLPQWNLGRMRITMPHLLIWGMKDTALLPESREDLDALCDDLQVVEVPDADHWIIHQKPDLVAEKMNAFLGQPA